MTCMRKRKRTDVSSFKAFPEQSEKSKPRSGVRLQPTAQAVGRGRKRSSPVGEKENSAEYSWIASIHPNFGIARIQLPTLPALSLTTPPARRDRKSTRLNSSH